MDKGNGFMIVDAQCDNQEDYAAYLGAAFHRAVRDFAQRNGRRPNLADINFRGSMTITSVVIVIEEVD